MSVKLIIRNYCFRNIYLVIVFADFKKAYDFVNKDTFISVIGGFGVDRNTLLRVGYSNANCYKYKI